MVRGYRKNPRTLHGIVEIGPEARQTIDETEDLRRLGGGGGTEKQYLPKQEMWKRWCKARAWPTGETVTPHHALMFIYEAVLPPDSPFFLPGSRKRAAASLDEQVEALHMSEPVEAAADPQESELLDMDGLRQVDNEIDHLRSAAAHVRPEESLGTSNAARAIATTRLSKSTVNGYVAALVDLWNSQVNRGINSYASPRSALMNVILNALMKLQAKRNAHNYVDKGSNLFFDGYQSREEVARSFEHYKQVNTLESLRNAAGHALGLFGLLRSDNQREMMLSDLSSITSVTEGPTPCPVIVLTLRRTKVTTTVRYGSFMRNADVRICPVSHLALYLFARFNVNSHPEKFPDLSARARWYDIHLLSVPARPEQGVSYSTQRSAIGPALAYAGVHTYQKTHVNRKGGARMAEIGGAPAHEIRRLGNWQTGVMEERYLTHLSYPAMRALAGFKVEGGTFFLPRAVVPPPTLVCKFFPDLEHWDKAFSTRTAGEQDLAARAFLDTLKALRLVLIQDAPHWRRLHPSLFVWRHTAFSDPEWLQYEAAALKESALNESLVDQRLETALPLLTDVLTKHAQASQQALARVAGQLDRLTSDYDSELQIRRDLRQAVLEIQNALTLPLVIPGPLQRHTTSYEPAQARVDPHELPGNPTGLTPPAEDFTMSRDIHTVQDAWLEYAVGLSGRPSVRDTYEGPDRTWRRHRETERRYYDRRKILWNTAVKRASAAAVPVLEMVARMDTERQARPNSSLDSYCKYLNALDKGGPSS